MSRIGRMPVVIPAGVTCTIGEGNLVTVKGPKGQLAETYSSAMTIAQEDGQLLVSRSNDSKENRSLHGLTRSLIQNMVTGVTAGFKRDLEIVGTGYRAQKSGNKLVLTVGYSHPVEIVEPEGIKLETPAPNKVSVTGIDKQKVGAVAAQIRSIREPEPYHGKGIRYEGEKVRRKEGKTGKK